MKTIGWMMMSVAAVAALMAATAVAADAKPAADEEGFTPIFNGKDLTGWDYDPRLWSVVDGAIRGQTTKENPTQGNTFCIWTGGKPANFILKIKFRIENGNSGIQYRSMLKDVKPGAKNRWGIRGYQAEVDRNPGRVGYLYDEARRGRIVYVGEFVQLDTSDKKKFERAVIGAVSDKNELIKANYYTPGVWAEYTITCRGNYITHAVNGHPTMALIDNDTKNRTMEGLIALQIHAGAPMVVEYKDIRIKMLGDYGPAVRLFNGKDLTGWDVPDAQKDTWSVKDGVLAVTGKPNGFIATSKAYTNFELAAQVRHLGKTNSGILLRSTQLDQTWPRSIEAQCKSGSMGDIHIFGEFPLTADEKRKHRSGVTKMHESNENPIGQWDQYDISLIGGDLMLKVNGLVQNLATKCEQTPGRICLQSEGGPLEFRNLVLMPVVDKTPKSK